MRAYGPIGLRAPRMAKALGDWTYFFYFISRHIIWRVEVFVFFCTSLTFLIFTVVHDVSPMVIEIGGHIRMKQIFTRIQITR